MSRIVIRRVRISAVREGEIKRFDAEGVAGEQFLDREFFQQFGITSRPKAGAEGILIGAGNVFYLIASDDRTARPKLANDGDMAIYTDANNYVLIKASGDIEVKSATKVTVNAPAVELGDGTVRKLIDERVVEKINNFITNDYGVHMHPTAGLGPPSAPSAPASTITLADVATEKTKAS